MDMPLPLCMQDLRKIPPVAVESTSDHQVLMFLKSFGTRLRLPEDEIFQACKLALGPGDLAILLEGPGPKHGYSVTFEQFVADCKTLNAIDELIRFATKGTRCIGSVTVLDAFSFKPSKAQSIPSDNECKDLLAKIIRIKKPRVLLCCWSGECTNHWVEQFQSLGVGWLPLKSEGIIENQNAIIVRSFHPAKAVCYGKCNVNYRVLLIYRFVSAFAELSQPIQMPSWIKTVSEKSFDDARYDAR